MKQSFEVTDALLGAAILKLLIDRAVVSRAIGREENAERGRHRRFEVRQHESEREIGLVVNDEIFLV